MRIFRTLAIVASALIALAASQGAGAAERRLALVIGEAAYPVKPIATAANDAGLIAQTLQAAGFDVTGARDLEEAALKQAFRDFLDKAVEAGPDTVAFVYISGYGLQLEGENYIVPVDGKIGRDTDIPMRALRVSDYLKPLAASGTKLGVVVLDIARANPFQLAGQPLAGGLALYEPGGHTLLAYNAAPGTIAPEATGDYGPYAHALAEMIRDGGRPLMDVFDNTRLRVSELTKGAQVPWNSQRVETDFIFFQREAGAPPRKEETARMSQPISALGPEDGFSIALRRDTMQGYEEYVATYPTSPYVKRARAILAARREALTWRRSRMVDTPDAYWSYLRRYPKGPHAWDARRRLAEMRDELEPPPNFDMIDYGYPPPPPDEMIYVDQPVIFLADPIWAFAPPPPPPFYLLPPPPPNFIILPPPVIFVQAYVLPAPPYVPIPVWQRPPAYIAPPPDNVIYANVHNSVVLTPEANQIVVRNPTGNVISTETLAAAGVAGAGAAAVGVGAALPNFIAKRNAVAPAGMAPPPASGPHLAPGGAPVPGEGHMLSPGAERPAAPGIGVPGMIPPAAGLPPKDHALPQPPAGGPHDLTPSPTQGGQPPRGTPGMDRSGGPGSSPITGEGRAPGPKTIQPHSMPPQGVDGGGAAPTFRAPRGGTPGESMSAPTRGAPPQMREPPAAMPQHQMQEMPQGLAPPMRGVPRDVAPPRAEPMQTPHYQGGLPGGMPPQMREPPAGMPQHHMQEMPQGMAPSMRGVPRDVAPPRAEPMQTPHYQGGPPGGMPPQMREMAPPVMHAPSGPPPSAIRQPAAPFPQQAAPPPRYESAPAPRGGGAPGGFGGAPPGFGGGAPGGFGGMR